MLAFLIILMQAILVLMFSSSRQVSKKLPHSLKEALGKQLKDSNKAILIGASMVGCLKQ